jgi:predicted ATPase
MIINLKIKGFKNIKDLEISFGPLTCIAGANGVGKSNLFDAIRFLSALASKDNTLVDAALQVRDEKNKKRSVADLKNLFYHDGEKFVNQMEFIVDMIIPLTGVDHLGQHAKATTTSLRYHLIICTKMKEGESNGSLEILKEDLIPIKKSEIKAALKKFGSSESWIESILVGKRQNATPFIQTLPDEKIVTISQDQVKGGRKKRLQIDQLPRTILSTATAIEYPTMLLAKKELESWRILQLEPSALRSTDDINLTEENEVSANGDHLPITLYRLLNDKSIQADIKAQIGNRLSQLIDDVFIVDVDRDEKRGLLTMMVKGKTGPAFPARSLSDGTLRFIALSIIESDPQVSGLICLEEPENGIHPERIPAMVCLLKDIACDIEMPSDSNNPLRQIIVNTHSPLVVAEIPAECLLMATLERSGKDKFIKLKHLSDTWRDKVEIPGQTITKGDLIVYLNPYKIPARKNKNSGQLRVIDRKELGQLSLFTS